MAHTQPFRIDVGGRVFVTSETTLRQAPFFQKLLDNLARDEGKRADDAPPTPPFVDRNPEAFEHVLELLRDPGYPFPWSKWGRELDFYGLRHEPSPADALEASSLEIVLEGLRKGAYGPDWYTTRARLRSCASVLRRLIDEGEASLDPAFEPLLRTEDLASQPIDFEVRPPRFRKSDGLGTSRGLLHVTLFSSSYDNVTVDSPQPDGAIQHVLYDEAWDALNADRGCNDHYLRVELYYYSRSMDEKHLRDAAWWNDRVKAAWDKLKGLGWTLKGELPLVDVGPSLSSAASRSGKKRARDDAS